MAQIIYVDSARTDNTGNGLTAATAKKTLVTTTPGGVSASGTPANGIKAAGDLILIRRIHNEGFQSGDAAQALTAPAGTALVSMNDVIRIEAYTGSNIFNGAVVSVPTWDGDSVASKPNFTRTITSGALSANLFNVTFTNVVFSFKGLDIGLIHSGGTTTGHVFKAATATTHKYIYFENCRLRHTSTTDVAVNAAYIVSADLHPSYLGSSVVFVNCAIECPKHVVGFIFGTSNPGPYTSARFEGCDIKLLASSSTNCLVRGDDDSVNGKAMQVTVRNCTMNVASQPLNRIIAYATIAFPQIKQRGSICRVEYSTGMPDITQTYQTLTDLYVNPEIEGHHRAYYAGKDQNPEAHEILGHSYKVTRRTTPADLRSGGTTSIQEITFLNTGSLTPWAVAIPKTYPLQRQINNWLIRWNNTQEISRVAFYVKQKNLGAAPTILGSGASIYFTLEYVSNTSPFTVTVLDSSSFGGLQGETTLANNSWVGLYVDVTTQPAAANGYLRVRTYANVFDTSSPVAVYFEPDIIITA